MPSDLSFDRILGVKEKTNMNNNRLSDIVIRLVHIIWDRKLDVIGVAAYVLAVVLTPLAILLESRLIGIICLVSLSISILIVLLLLIVELLRD